MAFPQKLLNENEAIVLDLRPHWWFLAGSAVALACALVIGIVALVGDSDVLGIAASLVVLAALVWFGVRYLKWTTTNFVVTTDRLIYRTGVLAKAGIEIPLERVNTVFFNQSIFERILGAGDLVIESAGEQGRQAFSDVRKPNLVQNEIHRQMEENENRKFDRINRGGGDLSIPEQIEKLDELRERGVISDEEFAAKKAVLLDRM